jgi:hypothetical protein
VTVQSREACELTVAGLGPGHFVLDVLRGRCRFDRPVMLSGFDVENTSRGDLDRRRPAMTSRSALPETLVAIVG